MADSEFANVNDLPPTEEVSDNELENLDDFDRDCETSKLNNIDKQPSDNSNSTQDIHLSQRQPLDTYCPTEKKQILHISATDVSPAAYPDIVTSASTAPTTETCRPLRTEVSGNSAFSPHSPVSSTGLNDLDDIGSNSPSAFDYNCDHSSVEKNRFEPIENRSTAYNFQRSHQYPGFVEELGRKSADPNIQNIYHSANDRYITCSNPFRANLSPDRETERSGSYKFCNNPIQKSNYIVSGSDSDLDKKYMVSCEKDNNSGHFDRDIMAKDRHSNNHRSNTFDAREPKTRNYLRDNENDHFEANSKHIRRERSVSSDRITYPDKDSSMPKKRDKKSKKSKKKKDKKYREYRSLNRKGGKGDDYDEYDGSPVSSDPDVDGRDSRSSYRLDNSNRNRSGKSSPLYTAKNIHFV